MPRTAQEKAVVMAEAQASVALDKGDGETQVVEEAPVAQDVQQTEVPDKMPPLRLQSKYRNHSYQLKPPRRIFHPQFGVVEPIPGVWARFTGPQRIFDSEAAQKEFDWTDEERGQLEESLIKSPAFMVDFYPAPMSIVPPHLLEMARNKPPERVKKCFGFGFDEGQLVQCPEQATAGRDYCPVHDPDQIRILRGGGTTVG